MIAHLAGTVTGISPDGAVLDIGGVGLRVNCTPGTLAGLKPGDPARGVEVPVRPVARVEQPVLGVHGVERRLGELEVRAFQRLAGEIHVADILARPPFQERRLR